MPTITLTLEQLQKFLKRLNPDYGIRRLALLKCLPVLERTLRNRVFTYEEGNVNIKTKEELRRLISSGKMTHTPATPNPGATYDPDYLARKKRMGEDKPHKYENYSFWNNTEIRHDSGKIIMETQMSPTAEKNFDYLSHHERRRSVLKTTFLLSWQEIIETIIETYAKEAKK